MKKITKTEDISTIATSEVTASKKCEPIELCTLQFPNEDMNRLVEYINKLAQRIKC